MSTLGERIKSYVQGRTEQADAWLEDCPRDVLQEMVETILAMCEDSEVAGCGCTCHEEFGGGAHPGARCRCRGGAGFDDLSVPD